MQLRNVFGISGVTLEEYINKKTSLKWEVFLLWIVNSIIEPRIIMEKGGVINDSPT